MQHIRHTERSAPSRRFIRSDGALYVLLLVGAFGAIALSRYLAKRMNVNMLWVQAALYAMLLGTGYAIYRMRLVEYLYELYDTELRVVQVVGAKQKTLLTVPVACITEIGPYRKTDAKPDPVTFHGAREKTTAVWYADGNERRVLCLNASDALREKLTEAAHAEK